MKQREKKSAGRKPGTFDVGDEKVAEVLLLCGGRVSDAAKKLGYSVDHLRDRIARSELLKKTVESARESLIDMAESALVGLIQSGDTQAVLFTLKTLGRKRGFVTEDKPSVVVHNTNTNAVVTSGFGENPERQAKLKAMHERLRASAQAERNGSN